MNGYGSLFDCAVKPEALLRLRLTSCPVTASAGKRGPMWRFALSAV